MTVEKTVIEKNEKTTFICEFKYCRKEFNSLEELNDHSLTHTGAKPYVCPFSGCNKAYCQPNQLKRHIRSSHTKEKLFQCSICGLHFVSSSNLKRHQKYHEEAHPYQCEHCDEKFRKKAQLRTHIKEVHNILPHVCKECGASFEYPSKLKRHIETHHSIRVSTPKRENDREKEMNSLERICPVCGKQFKNKINMVEHVKEVHEKTECFECSFCGRSFVRLRNLKAHIKRVHEKTEQFPCEFCGKTFSYKHTMKRHQLICSRNPEKDEKLAEEKSETVIFDNKAKDIRTRLVSPALMNYGRLKAAPKVSSNNSKNFSTNIEIGNQFNTKDVITIENSLETEEFDTFDEMVL
eukprot:TRINITY_DN485_c0_g1_i1.p1 TRINITY_DN485_c0_g1~~TRINITY_DN485_c0_g1_i1.p1  ORF type:complete len:350 (+),score=81.96 TRINITY_DN485_c0_g1_i1:54-1103(+)